MIIMFETQIELLYGLPIGILILTAIAMWFKVLNPIVALLSILAGIGVAWLLSPYTALIMTPLANSLWYGYSWGFLEALALMHIVTIFGMVGIAVYNLYRSGGGKSWA